MTSTAKAIFLTIFTYSLIKSGDQSNCSLTHEEDNRCSGVPGKRGPNGIPGIQGERGPKGEPGASDTWLEAFRMMEQKIRNLESELNALKDLPGSCQALLNQGQSNSGVYALKPNAYEQAINVYCDMTSGGGGWTLVASVHENNIDGKCTIGDKWSSEQGKYSSIYETAGNWENTNVFGDLQGITSKDYKNSAFYETPASDVMIWHVPNDIKVSEIEEKAFFKYHTSDRFLTQYGSTLHSFYNTYAPMRRSPANKLSTLILKEIIGAKSEITGLVSNWYNYVYDGSEKTTSNYIGDGGNDMFDNGNQVEFKANNGSYTRIRYEETYTSKFEDYEVVSAAIHPFTLLAWIGDSNITSFNIKVISDTGADGGGSYKSIENEFDYHTYHASYSAFHVYSASSDPSICEVYFYISNTQKWSSIDPIVEYPMWSNQTDSLVNEVEFVGGHNILTGYLLLSRTSGYEISESMIDSILQRIIQTFGYSKKVLMAIEGRKSTIYNSIPNRYTYSYDVGTTSYYISTGGGSMFRSTTNNQVEFKVNDGSYQRVQYGQIYVNSDADYEVVSAAIHPFTTLAWIGSFGISSFNIKVRQCSYSRSYNEFRNQFTIGSYQIFYRAFQFYGSYPSACEVFFYISNTELWSSVPPSTSFPNWSTSYCTAYHEIRFTEAKRILAGYLLLSRTAGNSLTQSHIEAVLQHIVSTAANVPHIKASPDTNQPVFSSPVTFIKGDIPDMMSRIPSNQADHVTVGHLQLRAHDLHGLPYALCPGVRMNPGTGADPAMHCIGGINSNAFAHNRRCGDFADWKGPGIPQQNATATGRSLSDIGSSILIFTRN